MGFNGFSRVWWVLLSLEWLHRVFIFLSFGLFSMGFHWPRPVGAAGTVLGDFERISEVLCEGNSVVSCLSQHYDDLHLPQMAAAGVAAASVGSSAGRMRTISWY